MVARLPLRKKLPVYKRALQSKIRVLLFFSSFSFSHFCHIFPRFISVEQTQLSLRLVQFVLLPPLKPEEAETQTDPGWARGTWKHILVRADKCLKIERSLKTIEEVHRIEKKTWFLCQVRNPQVSLKVMIVRQLFPLLNSDFVVLKQPSLLKMGHSRHPYPLFSSLLFRYTIGRYNFTDVGIWSLVSEVTALPTEP